MAIISRFIDPVEREVPGCPRHRGDLTNPNERACAGCAYNLAFPGEASIGCVVRTPADVFDAALSALEARDPGEAELLRALRRDHAQLAAGDEAADTWRGLAERWFDARQDDAQAEDELEVAAVVARFAQAASALGRAVEILA